MACALTVLESVIGMISSDQDSTGNGICNQEQYVPALGYDSGNDHASPTFFVSDVNEWSQFAPGD
eukprot:9384635-Karenia_brevis.AAC.1